MPEVACLEEYWAAHTGNGPPLDEMIGKLLLDTLGLGNQQVLEQLYVHKVDFDAFQAWILATAGPPDPVLLARYHGWLYERSPGRAAKAKLAAIAAMDPVLDQAALAHWDEHGYVILPDAITADEIEAVKTLLWQTIEASPDDPESWYAARTNGIMVPHFQHPALEAARRSPRVHKAFAQLWGSENLWVTIDRMGFNPPEREGHKLVLFHGGVFKNHIKVLGAFACRDGDDRMKPVTFRAAGQHFGQRRIICTKGNLYDVSWCVGHGCILSLAVTAPLRAFPDSLKRQP